MQPLVLVNTVGLTGHHLAQSPLLSDLARRGWSRPLQEVLPAVTCTTQATFLTGKTPQEHGIVGNGWLYRDTMEVRFWQQSNRLLQAEPLYVTARKRAAEKGRSFRCAKLFWWFNQGAAVDWSVTPKPHYAADGDKAFDIQSTPPDLAEELKKALGPFPFPAFWGPMAGLPASQWIGRCAAEVLRRSPVPDLTLVYLPHLDYATQRLGPDRCDWQQLLRELDSALEPVLDAAKRVGARVWVVNECTHLQVDHPVPINRKLREKGWLQVRRGPFGEQLDTYDSRAFAVCDHQIAHVYVRDPAEGEEVRGFLASLKGVARTAVGEERQELGLNHGRSGEVVIVAEPQSWFAYPFWQEDRFAPDYARTVDIHRKPGYDPCELFFDPQLWWPKGRVLRRLLGKKLGFRTLFDVVPLEPGLVRGSHGLAVADSDRAPVLIGEGKPPEAGCVPMTAVRDLILKALEE